MEKKRAKTGRMDAADWEAVKSIQEEYGMASDTDALRFALRPVLRDIREARWGVHPCPFTAQGRRMPLPEIRQGHPAPVVVKGLSSFTQRSLS